MLNTRYVPVPQTAADRARGVYAWRAVTMPEGGGTRVRHGIPILWSTFLLALMFAIITVGAC